jgi:hypothetical protein
VKIPRTSAAAIQDRLRQAFRTAFVGRTHDQIAQHLGVGRITVTKWLRSPAIVPSTAHVLTLAEKANISPSWLLMGSGPMLCTPPWPGEEVIDPIRTLHELAGGFLIRKGAHPDDLATYIVEQGDAVLGQFYVFYGEVFRRWLECRLADQARISREAVYDCLDDFLDIIMKSGSEDTGAVLPADLVQRVARLKASHIDALR